MRLYCSLEWGMQRLEDDTSWWLKLAGMKRVSPLQTPLECSDGRPSNGFGESELEER